MKNIIKRGTSLLLVVAMLLSFAVVVGAEPADATNTAVSGTFLKLRAEMVPLEAGKTANVKIFADLDDRYGIGQLNFNIYTDAGISIKQVNVNTKIGVKTGKNELNGIDLITWMSETPLGWDTDMDTNLTTKAKSVQLATLVLEATSDVPLGGV